MYFDEVNFALKVTNECQLRCPYCMVKEEFKATEMNTEVFKKALHLGRGFNNMRIQMMGGEPLLVPVEWFDLHCQLARDVAADRKQDLVLSVNTNAIKLTDKYMQVFKKHNVGVMISFDGLGNGPKGTQKILDCITKHAKDILMVTVTVSNENRHDLINTHKQLVKAGVRRYNLMYDFYANKTLVNKMTAASIELAEYISFNKSRTRNLTFENLKQLAKYQHSGMNNDMQFGRNHTMNDITVQPDGTVEPYVMFTDGYNLGSVFDYNHMLDISSSPEMLLHAKNYINSLDQVSDDVHLFKGSNYWGRLVTADYTKPNMNMIRFFAELMREIESL